MTGDMGDTEGNWMPNGMRLLAQALGAMLALMMVSKFGEHETGWAATDMWIADIDGDAVLGAALGDTGIIGMIAAGAIWWQVHTRCNSACQRLRDDGSRRGDDPDRGPRDGSIIGQLR